MARSKGISTISASISMKKKDICVIHNKSGNHSELICLFIIIYLHKHKPSPSETNLPNVITNVQYYITVSYLSILQQPFRRCAPKQNEPCGCRRQKLGMLSAQWCVVGNFILRRMIPQKFRNTTKWYSFMKLKRCCAFFQIETFVLLLLLLQITLEELISLNVTIVFCLFRENYRTVWLFLLIRSVAIDCQSEMDIRQFLKRITQIINQLPAAFSSLHFFQQSKSNKGQLLQAQGNSFERIDIYSGKGPSGRW